MYSTGYSLYYTVIVKIKNFGINWQIGHHDRTFWYRLDNAAKMFPTVLSKRITTLFRLSVTLTETIDPELLQKALEFCIRRFPFYKVNLKAGFFWHYFDENNSLPVVAEDSHDPCQYLPFKKNRVFPFRVTWFGRRIAVEFAHMLTDGSGAMIFLKTLTAQYLRLKGRKISFVSGVLDPHSTPEDEEHEDSFRRFYRKHVPAPPKLKRAFHLVDGIEPPGIYNLVTGIMSVSQCLDLARENNVSITEFLTSVYIDALQEILFSLPRNLARLLMSPIRIMVPVNLRKIYPSKTMRNFSLYVIPWIDPRLGRYTFDEILKNVHHYMRVEINDKYIAQLITRNMTGELHPVGRMMPLFLKSVIGPVLYNVLGEYLYTGVLTNLGPVDVPDDMKPYVERFDFLPVPSPVTKTNAAMVSYGDKLVVSFGRIIESSETERLFFTSLRSMGLDIKIESNYGGD